MEKRCEKKREKEEMCSLDFKGKRLEHECSTRSKQVNNSSNFYDKDKPSTTLLKRKQSRKVCSNNSTSKSTEDKNPLEENELNRNKAGQDAVPPVPCPDLAIDCHQLFICQQGLGE